ncbi:glycoside hydrolase family 16 protein [Flavobacterium sp. TBRC 19031]|uniref:glycoside hydrolase family 16 protein n=1 Tax=Flavobacterium mekongense TaxID=3379707 RepID=UPI00399A19C4
MNPKFSTKDFPPNAIEKENYTLEFNDNFEKDSINLKNWIPYYLPQWSSRDKSRPNLTIKNSKLILQITKEQKPWCPEFNENVKCSSIQTGIFAGPLGSNIGQHKFFNPKHCIVREEQTNRHTYLPQFGYFEIRAKALNTASNVVSLWMIGYENQPEKSGELCIFEIKGASVSEMQATVGYGIHKFNDPLLKEEFYEDIFNLDVTKFHIYAAEWLPNKIIFYIDNQKIKEIYQSPNYPMQFMLGIYELPSKKFKKEDNVYPKNFIVDYVRGYKIKS